MSRDQQILFFISGFPLLPTWKLKESLLLWVSVMIFEASGGILPYLVIYHHIWFYISPFMVVDYLLHPLAPEILWGDKSCWIASTALEPFSTTSVCTAKFLVAYYATLRQDKHVYGKIHDTGKILDSFPNFQKWQAILKLLSFLNALSYWDWTQMKDFLKLFADLTNIPYLSFTKVRLFMFLGEQRLML